MQNDKPFVFFFAYFVQFFKKRSSPLCWFITHYYLQISLQACIQNLSMNFFADTAMPSIFCLNALEVLKVYIYSYGNPYHHKLPTLIIPFSRLLEGHEYGGQCVSVLDNGIVFSASLDRTLRFGG